MSRIILVISAVLLTWLIGLATFVADLPKPNDKTPSEIDGVVVYTGGGGARITAAMTLFANGAGERMLISGVNRNTTRANMADLWSGAPERFDCCVDLGFEAETTVGNAGEAALWISQNDVHHVVLVTSDYHMPRALTESQLRMPNATIQPFVVASGYIDEDGRPQSLRAWKHLAGEYNKYLFARANAAAARFRK